MWGVWVYISEIYGLGILDQVPNNCNGDSIRYGDRYEKLVLEMTRTTLETLTFSHAAQPHPQESMQSLHTL